MTHSPPPDPLWYPSPPPTDPVLQQPAPMPWDHPTQPQPAAVPPPATPSDHPPPVSWPNLTRPRSTAPTRRPHAQPGTGRPAGSTQTWRPEPTRPKRKNGLIIGVIVSTLICGWTIMTRSDLGRRTVGEEPATVAPSRPRTAMQTPSLSAPVTTVDGGPESSFELPVGTAARFSDQDGTWTVALLGVEWIDECQDLVGDTAPAVAFDIRYEVTEGAVSIIPLTDFTFTLTTGATVRVGLPSTCVQPPLDYTVISAGDTHRGWIAMPLPSGARGVSGELSYGQMILPTASWTVPARGDG